MSGPKKSEYQRFKGQGWLEQGAGKLVPTTPDILGPFWKEGAPDRTADGTLYDPTFQPEDYFDLSGRIKDTDGNPVQGAVLDVWQADEFGDYDNAGFTLRGKFQAGVDDRGAFYRFRTIRPGCYKISEPGQPDEFRCAHVHVIVTAPGFKKLTTQLYFADSPHDDTDHWFSKDRCIRFGEPDYDTNGTFDFVLARES